MNQTISFEIFRVDAAGADYLESFVVRDGRLWVSLWPAEADTMHRAHVYDADGVFLHEAEWPLGIAIWHGGLSGDVVVGVRKVEFDVEQAVRLRFRPRPAPPIRPVGPARRRARKP